MIKGKKKQNIVTSTVPRLFSLVHHCLGLLSMGKHDSMVKAVPREKTAAHREEKRKWTERGTLQSLTCKL